MHPDPWHDVSEDEFVAAATDLKERLPSLGRDETLVELMRLVALLGARDGHSGVFPLDETHRSRPRLYPVRLFAFADGVRVVGGRPGLVGLRLVSVAGTPVDRLAAEVAPLVPADNDASRRARTWQWAVVAEVLHGLGLTPTPARRPSACAPRRRRRGRADAGAGAGRDVGGGVPGSVPPDGPAEACRS